MILEITYIYCINILVIQVIHFYEFCKKVLCDGTECDGTESFVPCTKQMEIFTKTHIFIDKVV